MSACYRSSHPDVVSVKASVVGLWFSVASLLPVAGMAALIIFTPGTPTQQAWFDVLGWSAVGLQMVGVGWCVVGIRRLS